MISLYIGGAHCGKSALAERVARTTTSNVTYVATARIHDAEMATRVNVRRQRRPVTWPTVEEPLRLAGVMSEIGRDDRVLIVDNLTRWVANLIALDLRKAGHDPSRCEWPRLHGETAALMNVLPTLPGMVLLISDELGYEVAPANATGRVLRDQVGRLNQAVAQLCDRVYWVVAGCPVLTKGTETCSPR